MYNFQNNHEMKEEMIESIFGCLERIEEKLDKRPVQSEQGKGENNGNLAEVLSHPSCLFPCLN